MAAASSRGNHVWVGTDTGILKGVNLQRRHATNFTPSGQPRREEAVNALCWRAGDETQVSGPRPELGNGPCSLALLLSFPSRWQILVGCADMTVRHFNTEEGTFQSQRHCPGGEGTFRGLAQADGTLITCVDSGILRVWCDNDKEASSDPLLELKVGPGVCRMRQDPAHSHVVATCGKENALKVWDLQKPEQPVFRAKNVRVYDPVSPQRRPVLEATYGEYPLTAMTLTPEGK
ncbi:putative gene 45736 [Cricetulus griseus]